MLTKDTFFTHLRGIVHDQTHHARLMINKTRHHVSLCCFFFERVRQGPRKWEQTWISSHLTKKPLSLIFIVFKLKKNFRFYSNTTEKGCKLSSMNTTGTAQCEFEQLDASFGCLSGFEFSAGRLCHLLLPS